MSGARVLVLAVVLVAWPAVLERFPQRWRPLIGAGTSTALAGAAGDSIPGTVLVTGMFGWLLGRLRERSGSVVAPMLAHLALNEAGAVATLYLGRSNVDLSPESASN